MGKIRIALALVLGLVLTYSSVSRPEERSPDALSLKLTLQEAVLLALANNTDIKIERLQPKKAETAITAEESVFDPAVKSDIGEGSRRREENVSPFITGSLEPFENVVNANAGIQKKFSTGALTELTFENRRLSTNSEIQRFNPSWDTDLKLSLTQPLLKDAGRYFNLGQISIAKNNKNISDLQFKQQVIQTISQVKQTYWDLVLAIELLNVAEQALELAQDLVRINTAKVEAGQLAPIDIIEAEAAAATREEEVILAQDTIEDLRDRLRDLLDFSGEAPWRFREILPVERPSRTEFSFSLEEEIETALTNRPDYLQAKTDLENRLINMKLAKNQVLPRVDIVGSAGITGLGTNYSDAIDEMDGDFYDLFIGLSFEYPLGNRAAKSQLTRRKLEKREVEFRIDDLERTIGLQVREAIRQVETDFKRITTTRAARRLAVKQLEGEQAKFEVGISTTRDVLDFQVALARARSRESAALIDYNQSLIALYQALGTTLEHSGITANMLESG